MKPLSETISQGNLRVRLESSEAIVTLTVQGKVRGQWLSLEEAECLPTKIDPKVTKDKLHQLARIIFDYLWTIYEKNQGIKNPVIDKDQDCLSITTHDGKSYSFPDLEAYEAYLWHHEPRSLAPLCRVLQEIKVDWLKKVPPKIAQFIKKHYPMEDV